MLSQFFYLPANQKVDEEKRIAFTQEKIKLVKDFLYQHFLSARYKDGHPFEFDENDWQVYVGEKVVINQNYWNAKIDEFQATNRCKIEQLDYLYLLMQLWRDVNGRKLSLSEGILGVSLFLPKKKIVKKEEPENTTTTTNEIAVKINPKKFHPSQIKFYVFLIPFSLFMIIPIIYLFTTAFKPADELFKFPPSIFVVNPTWDNFKNLFKLFGTSSVPASEVRTTTT